MTPEKRLDQIEPVIGEMLAVLDQHTALHRQTHAQIKQLTVTFTQAFTQQSDQINFLLNDAAERKEQITYVQKQIDYLLLSDSERKSQIASLIQSDSERKSQIASLIQSDSERKDQIATYKIKFQH
jgi:hypothetical protein